MKAHLTIALGLILAVIFVNRGLEALATPGVGVFELYVFGGFVLAGLLIRMGLKERKKTKSK